MRSSTSGEQSAWHPLRSRPGRAALTAAALLGLAVGQPVAAQGDAGADGDARGDADAAERDALPPSVGLERLLRLPDSYSGGAVTRGGATRSEWRERFAEVRQTIAEAKGDLAETQERLEQAAGDGSQWTASAPGLSSPSDPNNTTVSYKLRQQLREQRERVEEAEALLLDLQVRADLAEVPADWRE